MEKQVTRVPIKPTLERLQNVAAYARVSSGKDAMLHSLAAQVSYYSQMIREHPGWRFAGIYADEAMTGTKKADEKLARLKAEREDHLTRGKGIRRFLSALDGQPQNLDDWDEQAWNLLVSRVIIQRNGCVEFVFRGEITITVRAA